MHLGNVYAALLSYLSCKSQGGRWLLRVEDLDEERSHREYALQMMDDLQWLGLQWDLGPFWQSERHDVYEEQLARLQSAGHTFPCYLSRGEIMATQAPHESDGRVVYGPELRARNEAIIAAGIPARHPATRLRVPDRDISFEDRHYGLQQQNLLTGCGDFILRRGDGAWAYQLAVVADDALMGVTEVVRGRDLLQSVPQQLYLYELLGYSAPSFAHLPLLCNEQGLRLCKRDKALDMGELRKHYTAEQIVGFLAFHAGLISAPEPITPAELIPLFSWNKVPTEDIRVTPLNLM